MEIVLVGIGGQGVVFAAEVLARAALQKGISIIGSETYGMAQRGGSVISHLKMGPALSPLVRQGNTDLLYAFELSEFYRNLPFLKDGGVCVVNQPQNKSIENSILKYLKKHRCALYSIDADKIASGLNAPMVANLVIIGLSLSLKTLPFSLSDIEAVLREKSAPRFLETNLNALRQGY